jgi:5-formyltetrahydrofolate cyclo-ligase
MNPPTDRREAMRRLLRQRRADLPPDEQATASMAVMARLANLRVLRTAGTVAGYRAVRGEVDIDASLALLIDAGVRVTVPRVEGHAMAFVVWRPQDETVTGAFGITEPTGDDVVPFGDHDVVLVPLVAFDSAGRRLGQGGGFYDRAIGTASERPTLIGIAHSFQQVADVPTESWDQSLDAVITEDHVHEFTPGVLLGES